MNDPKELKLQLLNDYQVKLGLSDLELGQVMCCPASYDTEYHKNAYYRKYIKQKKGEYKGRGPSVTKSNLILLDLLYQLNSKGYSVNDIKPDFESGEIDAKSWAGDAQPVIEALKSRDHDPLLPGPNIIFSACRKHCGLSMESMASIFFEYADKKDSIKRIRKIELPTIAKSIKKIDAYLCHIIAFAYDNGIDVEAIEVKIAGQI
jgi:hypothetical protein